MSADLTNLVDTDDGAMTEIKPLRLSVTTDSTFLAYLAHLEMSIRTAITISAPIWIGVDLAAGDSIGQSLGEAMQCKPLDYASFGQSLGLPPSQRSADNSAPIGVPGIDQ